jgi:hypothetical protein
MSREVHVRFWESVGVGLPRATRLPLYRQSEIYAREGVELSRSTLAEWVGQCHTLLRPLVDELKRHVLTAEKLHADDTPVPVLDPGQGRTRTGRLWTYVRDDRPWGDETRRRYGSPTRPIDGANTPRRTSRTSRVFCKLTPLPATHRSTPRARYKKPRAGRTFGASSTTCIKPKPPPWRGKPSSASMRSMPSRKQYAASRPTIGGPNDTPARALAPAAGKVGRGKNSPPSPAFPPDSPRPISHLSRWLFFIRQALNLP